MDKITQQNAANSEESASAREKNNFRPLLILVSIVLCTMQIAVSALAVYEKAVKDVHTIVVGTELDYPPYSFLDEKGNPSGYNVELTRAIARVMGLNVEIQIGPWGDIRKALKAGKIDVISGMYYSEERDKLVDFSPPYTIVHHAIFARKDSPEIESEDDLYDKDIIVMRGDIMHDYVLEKDMSECPVLVGTQAETLRLLASGEHDYALIAKLPGLYWVKKLELTNILVIGPLMRPSEYSYAVSKGNTELLNHFSEGLSIMKETGRYKEIYDKWLGILEPPGVSTGVVLKYATFILFPLLFLLAGSVLWTRSLKRQVAQRTEELKIEIDERKKAEDALMEQSEGLEEMVEERTKDLKDAQEQLVRREKLAILGQLAGGVGHELRSPLGVISNAVYYLKMVLTDPGETVKEYLETISEEVSRSTDIVTDLLDLSRARPAERDIVEATELITDAVQRRPPPDDVEVITEISSALPPLFVDPRQIGQVLDNLVINAYQAMPEGGKVTIRAKAREDRLIFSITDTGCGIPQENLGKLFEPLFTTRARGIGLGLAISRNLVEANGGSIEVKSEEGKGSVFTVALPSKEATA